MKLYYTSIMRATITISLPEDLKNELDALTGETGAQRSDVVQEAIRTHLAMRRFRSLRERLMALAQSRGIHTDDDVARLVS